MKIRQVTVACTPCGLRWSRGAGLPGTCPSCLATASDLRLRTAEDERDAADFAKTALGTAYATERKEREEAQYALGLEREQNTKLTAALDAALDVVAALRVLVGGK